MKKYIEQPRIRTVKPQLFKHEVLFQTEQETQLPLRLAFIGLFGACNRWGCFRWQAQRLKSDILPYDAVDFEAVLQALVEAGFIGQYAYENELYGCIPSWSLHQVIGKLEPISPIPCLGEDGDIFFEVRKPEPVEVKPEILPPPVEALSEAVQMTQVSSEADVRGREGKGWGGKGSGREGEDLQHPVAATVVPQVQPLSVWDATQQLFAYWKRVMNHPESQLDAKRRPLIARALKLGYSVEALYQAILGCSLTPHNQGQNERGQRFDGLHIILRDSDPIDRFIHNAQYPPKSLNGSERRLSGNLERLQAWVEKHEESTDATH